MKIYLLSRDDYGYDEYSSKVVIAKNEERARELANDNTGDEGRIWTNSDLVFCNLVGTKTEGVLLGAFNAG